ncbi:MAG TPA: Maf family protein [Steroidobacteraceae bacterium]|nr:Maf family protein [Steroidobacteraceae bacterium]
MDSSAPVLCLASLSPRRRELLAQIGVNCSVVGADIDESVLAEEGPRDYVIRLAQQKALAVRRGGETLPVLAADTTVLLEGRIYGKPKDQQDSLAMLRQLSGRTHEVLTAVALADSQGVVARLSQSTVVFRKLTLTECAAYWDSGEPRDKAGSYAIQGLGAVFVESLSGSYSGVMGLPLFETAELLRASGIAYWSGRVPP